MISAFYPDEYLDSPYTTDFATYYETGFRGILFDIDNTLVPHGAPATGEAVAFFKRLHALGFATCLISNNKEARVKPFADAVGSGYVFKADKPLAHGYREGMIKMNTIPATTLFVGDQLFTDVWGAKRLEIHTILVRPIDKKEEVQIVLKRFLEKPVLWMYERKQRKPNRSKESRT